MMSPKCSQASKDTQSLQHVLGLPQSLLPVGLTLMTSSRWCPWRHPSYLKFLLMQRRSKSILTHSQITKLLNLRLSPGNLCRYFCCFVSIYRIIWGTIHNLSPRWRWEHRLTSTLTVSALLSALPLLQKRNLSKFRCDTWVQRTGQILGVWKPFFRIQTV